MKPWWAVALAVVLAFRAVAVVAAPSEPQGVAKPGGALRDRDFGVSTRQFGLDRRVEMYQWRGSAADYQRVWNSALIDSSRFAPGHENPPSLPLQSRRWWARGPGRDGRPFDGQVLHRLGTWRRFRPDFARLPANLAASFQPEGDGLSTSDNPLAPQIGDLRVSWRELVLPPLAGKVELRDGVWRLTARAAAAPPPPADEPRIELVDPLPPSVMSQWPWLLGGVALAMAVIALVLRRLLAWRRRRRPMAPAD